MQPHTLAASVPHGEPEPGSISAYLTADHARLRALLVAADGDPFDHVAFERFRAGILRHIGIEEKVLLREVRIARGGEPIAAAHPLRMEHAAITSLLVPTPDHALVEELRRLLDEHDAREEGAIYAECETILGARSRELAALAAQYREVPTLPHFDGSPGRPVYRTARDALAAAQRITAPRRTPNDVSG